MADFVIALNRVLRHEGGYVNDPDDKGGETYKGISRKAHSKDIMWTYVDNYKKKYSVNTKQFKTALENDTKIQNRIKSIYKICYWNPFKLDKVKFQYLANEIFDDAVNRGVAAACRTLCTVYEVKIVSKPSAELLEKLQK